MTDSEIIARALELVSQAEVEVAGLQDASLSTIRPAIISLLKENLADASRHLRGLRDGRNYTRMNDYLSSLPTEKKKGQK